MTDMKVAKSTSSAFCRSTRAMNAGVILRLIFIDSPLSLFSPTYRHLVFYSVAGLSQQSIQASL